MDHPKNIEQKFNDLLNELEQHIVADHLNGKLADYKPLFGKRELNEGQYVIKENGVYQLWYTERGESGKIIESANMDDVLYLLFEGITQSLVTTFESRNRNPKSIDTRRDWFPLQEELMGHLSTEWREKLHRKLSKLLEAAD
ncbi:MAG: Imm63 family immunity protein [Bdellovibrionota bacterium]